MHIKLSKCSFAVQQIEYLGHFISSKGVETDLQKISAITCWQVPKTVKELRGFLGLAGYYRKFIKGYALLSKPLTNLLKTGAFQWTKEAQHSFEQLKNALSTAPVLAVPNFDIPFEIETDASQFGIGLF
ncbi:putative mitochondrial protein AtMg00860 [Apium graveolens]|uniref:putative mitochondrial protein AtMg00860 n=1 Tax=Apium graveolens TaxID=4045 RepID=UPI003D79E0AD